MAPKRQGEIVKCDNCGKDIYRPQSLIKPTNFCCRHCRSEWQRGINNPNGKPKVAIPCQKCGKLFEVEPHKAGKRRYCSQACAGVAKVDYVAVQCYWCGKELLRQPSWAKREQRHFCDMTCKGAWLSTLRGAETGNYKGTRVQVECSQCGKQIERDPSKVKRNNHFFCGAACWDEWRKVNMRGEKNPNFSTPAIGTTCAWCGVAIQRKPWKIGTEKRTRHFCCAAHRAEWLKRTLVGKNSPLWKGGEKIYYGPNWNEQKRLARKRDNNTCQVCGRTQKKNGKALDVHHVVPFRSFNYIPGENENYLQANELTNLICLCKRCHRKAEWGTLPLQPRLV